MLIFQAFIAFMPLAVVVDSHTKTTCRTICPRLFSPVCASNQQTYNNECLMEADSCLNNLNLKVVERGPCNKGHISSIKGGGQKNIKPNPDRPLIVDPGFGVQPLKPTCDTVCPKLFSPVCASNMQTYHSVCHMESDSCLKNLNLKVVKSGPCHEETINPIKVGGVKNPELPLIVDPGFGVPPLKPTCNTVCPKLFSPVCASNKQTYLSVCLMESDSCLKNLNLKVVKSGPCHEEIINPIKVGGVKNPKLPLIVDPGFKLPPLKPICNTVCPKLFAPVCASNKQTYGNECEMESDSCLENQNLKVVRRGPCKEEGQDHLKGSGDSSKKGYLPKLEPKIAYLNENSEP